MQPYLPTLKMKKGSPDELPRGDVKKSELEMMCNHLIGALPLSLSASYFASKGAEHFPLM